MAGDIEADRVRVIAALARDRSPRDRRIIDTGDGDDNAAGITASFTIIDTIGERNRSGFAVAQRFEITSGIEAVGAIGGQAQKAGCWAGNQAVGQAVAIGITHQAGNRTGQRGRLIGCRSSITSNRGRVGNFPGEVCGYRGT